MMVSPGDNRGNNFVMVPSVISPAGTINQTMRGALSLPTMVSSVSAVSAPFFSSDARAASAGSKPTTR